MSTRISKKTRQEYFILGLLTKLLKKCSQIFDKSLSQFDF